MILGALLATGLLATAPAAEATTEALAPPDTAEAPPEPVAPDASLEPGSLEPSSEVITAAAEPEATAEPEAAAEPEPAAEPEAADAGHETLHRAVERSGPPYYSEADQAELRERHGIKETEDTPREPVRWRCLIADPTCGTSFEVNALSAYGRRFQQGNVSTGDVRRWNTGRAQYDLWVNIPVFSETRRRTKFTRMTLGPKGGLVFSDTGDFWGNFGIAARYWLGRGRFAPSIEFSSALAFKLGGRPTNGLLGGEPKFVSQRGPVGFVADVGVGIGGFGAIVVGGQYDSPLAREDVPEQFRVAAGGMFYVGFRGNILWGAPAAAAIATHGITQRTAERPR